MFTANQHVWCLAPLMKPLPKVICYLARPTVFVLRTEYNIGVRKRSLSYHWFYYTFVNTYHLRR